jgi:hypothetical protein
MPAILKKDLGGFRVAGADIGNAVLVSRAEFARWKAQRGVGLGDLVYWAARLTGLGALAKVKEKATGKPCGCNRRREKLNAIRVLLLALGPLILKGSLYG